MQVLKHVTKVGPFIGGKHRFCLVSLAGIRLDQMLSKPFHGAKSTAGLTPKLQHNRPRDMLVLVVWRKCMGPRKVP